MNHILRIVKIARPYHKYFIALAILIVLSTVLDLTGTVVMKFAVDEIERQIRDQTGDIVVMYKLLFFLFLFSLSGIILNILSMRIGDYTSGRIGKYLTELFYKKIFSLSQHFFDSEISGKIVNQLSRGIYSLENFLGTMTNFIVPAFVQTVVIIGMLLYYSPLVGVLAFAIFPLYLWISKIATSRWARYQVKRNKLEDQVRGRIHEVIGNMRLVRAFNMQTYEIQFVSNRLKRSVGIYDKQSKEYHILNFWRNFGLEVSLVGIAYIVFAQTFKGVLTFGELVLLFQLFNRLRRPLFAMSFILEQIKRAQAGSKEFFEILDLPSIEKLPRQDKVSLIKNPTLVFDHVYFEYQKGDETIQDVSFRLMKKEIVALVGHSGAGKSTIVNLILKLYSPSKGKILLGGKDYRTLSHEYIRAHISLVFQESELFSSTIRKNVCYGKPSATDGEIVRALKKANAYDFVRKLPEGLDSKIGERGVKLSGGQKQRIQIARAIIHNSPILILDEATSSLDAKSERLVQEALMKLMEGRLVIVIAHRFSTIQNADRIIVIDNGKIVDSGKPHVLAKKQGVYSELLRYQIEGNKKLLQKYDLH